MNSKDIRSAFFDFFRNKNHVIVPSSPMVIKDDPTLMFTNAGMNQFKDFFLGTKHPKNKRLVNSQKCLRVSGKHNDLEEVGVDTYHHTMFEMLGNWSFGDYFKKEAISWSWELFIEVYKLDKSRLYVTVFDGDKKDNTSADEESYEFWKKHVDEDHILRCSKKDNFWEMGAQGPCGPSSEIHIDIRKDKERKEISGRDLVNKDHPQVVELWNLVFIEYNRKANGSLETLSNKHVDTGMGLERLAMVLQSKKSNYDSDLFSSLIQRVEKISNKKYSIQSDNQKQEKINIAIRVIVDHVRAISFSIADGQMPSNTGAGYVIRRILRRAVRYGYQYLGIESPFLHELIEDVSVEFKGVFDEVYSQKELIKKVVYQEENSFYRTLEIGLKRIEQICKEAVENEIKSISGKLAFELYDRYGFPFDLTKLIIKENNLLVDDLEFEKALSEQKTRSKKDAEKELSDWAFLVKDSKQEFIGYDETLSKVSIVKYRKVKVKGKFIYQLVFNITPFYPEGGGQIGDVGFIENGSDKTLIKDTKKENGEIIHITEKLPSNLKDEFIANVDVKKRGLSAKNHTSTHLLHLALRTVLGDHVEQKGSLVNPEYLRFDFSHFSKVSKDELEKVERMVNEEIRKSLPLLEKRKVPINEAKESGAMMLFGEKYGEEVRTIQFGDSIELCGGIHVNSTSEIGNFKILSESSISAGIRRIEAISSAKADEYIASKISILDEVSDLLKNPNNVVKAIQDLQQENQRFLKLIENYKKEKLNSIKSDLISSSELINDINFIGFKSDLDADSLKKLAFDLKGELSNLFLVLISNANNKPLISIMIDDSLVQSKDWNAGKIIRELAKEIKGGGGGQAFFATAGGSDLSGLDNVIPKAKKILFT
ncbi:MAG: alanine--tRNA ligase [Crocinitomicaceae bacterium]|nr:alanine--tRNA ligase [Crocinitomicaceae bacterium]